MFFILLFIRQRESVTKGGDGEEMMILHVSEQVDDSAAQLEEQVERALRDGVVTEEERVAILVFVREHRKVTRRCVYRQRLARRVDSGGYVDRAMLAEAKRVDEYCRARDEEIAAFLDQRKAA